MAASRWFFPSLGNEHRRTLLLTWLLAGLLLALTWWHAVALVSEGRARDLQAAEKDLSNLTRVIQEHAERTFNSADQAVRFVQARYLEQGDRLDLTALTQQGVIDTSIFNQVGVIDANGMYALANRPLTGRLDLSDREHFKVHVATDTGKLFVSKPVIGRATGKWSIQLTRRISRPNGDFAGVVVISIDPGYFTRFYKELNLGAEGLSALYGLDGVARARIVGQKEDFTSVANGSTMLTRIEAGEQMGSYMTQSVVDGVNRLFYFRKLPKHPLVVVAGMNTRELLTNHLKARDALYMQAGLVSLLILALGLSLTRYLLGISREMQARQQAQAQLEDRTEQLNAIFDMSPDGFVSFDRDHRVKYVSPAFVQMTGKAADQLEGLCEQAFSEWLASCCVPGTHFADITSLRAHLERELPSERNLIEIAYKGQRVLQIALRISQASTVSAILYVRDVTHENEVTQMKSEFLTTAAHELRTPMASILGFAELLLNHPFSDEERKEFLGIIHNRAQWLSRILDDVLDLARIEARRDKELSMQVLSLQQLVQDAVASFPIPPGRSMPALSLCLPTLKVLADRGKIQKAIWNALSNAYKFSPDDGPVNCGVSVCAREGQLPCACIEITDTGIGMTAEQVARVGERFFRADTSGENPGTGLGMAITKEIIELHQGSVHIQSAPGCGTQVMLRLPLQAEAVSEQSFE